MNDFVINGIYEVAVLVRDLERAEEFYREILGLTVGLRDETRRWLFLRAGDGGVLVLQEDKSDWPKQHFAFTVNEENIVKACQQLSKNGIIFEGPVTHEWMPAKSVYFSDPDGHDLELCVPLRNDSKNA